MRYTAKKTKRRKKVGTSRKCASSAGSDVRNHWRSGEWKAHPRPSRRPALDGPGAGFALRQSRPILCAHPGRKTEDSEEKATKGGVMGS